MKRKYANKKETIRALARNQRLMRRAVDHGYRVSKIYVDVLAADIATEESLVSYSIMMGKPCEGVKQ